MIITYENVILACWATFLVVWTVFAFNVKRDIRGGYGDTWRRFWFVRLVAAAVLLFVVIRIATGTAHYTNPGWIFSNSVFPQFPLLGWAAALLSVVGVGVAIWARVHLGRNWSPVPAVKEDHELVTTGPYAYVRHPIYTGVILMALAVALTGTIFGVIVFIVASLVFVSRIRKEESIMLELFPSEYPEYRKRTKALLPFII